MNIEDISYKHPGDFLYAEEANALVERVKNVKDGKDGSTWHQGSGVPSELVGVDFDYYIDTVSNEVYRKSVTWGTPIMTIKGDDGIDGINGTNGIDGVNGVDGDNAYVYVAYADDDIGTGFTMTFDENKNYIAILSTDTEIVTPVQDDFAGLWKNYSGSGGGIRPYVSTLGDIGLTTNTTNDVIIQGDNFDNNTTVYLGDEVTINYIVPTPTQLLVNYTTSANIQASTPIEVKNGDLVHFGNTVNCFVLDVVVGTGPAGIFLTNFNGGGTGQTAVGANWFPETFGNIISPDTFFLTSNNGTPSSNTGPIGNFDGTNFLFNETSGVNSGAGSYGQITTSYFRELTHVDFDYYMYGADIGALVVESQDQNDVWTERWRQNGQSPIHPNQTSGWGQAPLDATTWNAKAIRIVFEAASGFTGDICIDNLQLTSI